MAVKLIATYLLLKLKLFPIETCKTSRLKIATKVEYKGKRFCKKVSVRRLESHIESCWQH